MITRRMAAALVAGSLAVGLVAGTAGTIIAKDAPSQTPAAACIDHMDDLDSMMAGQNGMMSGSGGMMGGGSGGMMSGPNGSGSVPDWMQQHHVAATPAPVQ